jgi:hypothetical protein
MSWTGHKRTGLVQWISLFLYEHKTEAELLIPAIVLFNVAERYHRMKNIMACRYSLLQVEALVYGD